jgi:hypothetical protein
MRRRRTMPTIWRPRFWRGWRRCTAGRGGRRRSWRGWWSSRRAGCSPPRCWRVREIRKTGAQVARRAVAPTRKSLSPWTRRRPPPATPAGSWWWRAVESRRWCWRTGRRGGCRPKAGRGGPWRRRPSSGRARSSPRSIRAGRWSSRCWTPWASGGADCGGGRCGRPRASGRGPSRWRPSMNRGGCGEGPRIRSLDPGWVSLGLSNPEPRWG